MEEEKINENEEVDKEYQGGDFEDVMKGENE